MRNGQRRRVSAGTVAMLLIVLVVAAASVFVALRLSSGANVDLTKLKQPAETAEAAGETAETAGIIPASDETPSPSPAPVKETRTEAPAQGETSFTLTIAGTAALDGELRKNSYYSDVKQYDYYDVMTPLKKELQSDVSIVFLENILNEDGKITDVTAPGAAAAMLKAAGFNIAACGFSRAYERTEAGLESTVRLLKEHGIDAVGIYPDGTGKMHITEVNGIRTAILQYTGTMEATTRRNMDKAGTTGAVPPADAEGIAQDIAAAREQGCGAVIVLLNWGKTGKEPDKAQRTLAQQIADAGADLIVGNGSRIVSGAETLTAAGSGRQVLCVWSLGTAVSGDRTNIRRIAGMLLHATVRQENGQTEVCNFSYTPLYTWKYKMDGRFYYRCLPVGGSVPDGMDSEQQKMMKKAAETVRNAMQDAPAEERHE